MQILKDKLAIDFMGRRHIAIIFSAVLLALAIGSLLTRGLNFGIDFTGGTLVGVGYQGPADLGESRAVLEEIGYPEAQAQPVGTSRDVVLRMPPSVEKLNV